jgi:uncharacterized C2H2 Zn-finger protein
MAIRDQGGGEAHECPTCGEEFPTDDELQRHIDETHQGGATPTVILDVETAPA